MVTARQLYVGHVNCHITKTSLLTFVVVWIVRVRERSSRTIKRIRVVMIPSYKPNQYVDIIVFNGGIRLLTNVQRANFCPLVDHFPENISLDIHRKISCTF